MPQLDLSWFIINFFLAWILVTIIWLTINNQNWINNNNESSNESNDLNTINTNNWNW